MPLVTIWLKLKFKIRKKGDIVQPNVETVGGIVCGVRLRRVAFLKCDSIHRACWSMCRLNNNDRPPDTGSLWKCGNAKIRFGQFLPEL